MHIAMQVANPAVSSSSSLSREEIQELVRRAALKEAAARLQRTQRSQSSDAEQHAQSQDSPSTSRAAETDREKGRSEDLLEALEIERAKNDASWRQVQKDLSVLRGSDVHSLIPFDKKASKAAKQAEIALLDFRIRKLTEENSTLPPEKSASIRELSTKSALLDTIDQYEEALTLLEAELEEEKEGLERDKQLLADLKTIDAGLRKKQAQLEQRKADVTEEELVASLTRKLRGTERDLSRLLSSLIKTSNSLFQEERQRVQLRAFLDALMNRAWDTPADPYVSTNKFPSFLSSFLVRANIAVEHPRDSKRLRLVAFQKKTRG